MSLPQPLANVRLRPGMYLSAVAYDPAVGFVQGYDAATSGGLLFGFREWLVTRLGEGNNLTWPTLVRALMEASNEATGGRPGDETAVEFLFATLESFLRERDQSAGLRRIYARYEDWLRQQEWYTPSSPDWISTR